MTVQTLLANMSQKELCHWIAYHKIEREEFEEKHGKPEQPEQKAEKQKAQVVINDKPKEVPQAQKDALMLQQLLALVSIGKQKKREKIKK